VAGQRVVRSDRDDQLFGISIALLFLRRGGVEITTYQALLLTIAVTTVCWLLTACLDRRRIERR